MHNYLQRTYIYIYIFASQQRSESVNWDHPTGLMKISPKIEQFFLYHDVFVGFTIFYLKTCWVLYTYIYIYIHINIMCICIYIYGDGSKPCTSGEYQNGNLHLKIYGIIHRFYHVLSHPMPSACSHEPARTGHRWPANFKRSACCGSTAWATSSDGFRALYKVRPSGDVNVGL